MAAVVADADPCAVRCGPRLATMALSPLLPPPADVDTSRQVSGSDATFLRKEIAKVKGELAAVNEALSVVDPSPFVPTLPLSQLVIRNASEIGLMSEGDLLQEMANVSAGIIECHRRLDEPLPASSLQAAIISVANELERISDRDRQQDGETLYCLCRLPYSSNRSMIQCDVCDEWYHLTCVGLSLLAAPPASYQCPLCSSPVSTDRLLDADDIPEDVTQAEVDPSLCAKGVAWLTSEIAATESELGDVTVEVDLISAELHEIHRLEDERAARLARKLAKEERVAAGLEKPHSKKRKKKRRLTTDSRAPLSPVAEEHQYARPVVHHGDLGTYEVDPECVVPDEVSGEELSALVLSALSEFGFTQAAVAAEIRLPGGASAFSTLLRGHPVPTRETKEAILRKWLAVIRTKERRGELHRLEAPPSALFAVGDMVEAMDATGTWRQVHVIKTSAKRVKVLWSDGEGKSWVPVAHVALLGTHTQAGTNGASDGGAEHAADPDSSVLSSSDHVVVDAPANTISNSPDGPLDGNDGGDRKRQRRDDGASRNTSRRR